MIGAATAGLRAPLAAAPSLPPNQARSPTVLACMPCLPAFSSVRHLLDFQEGEEKMSLCRVRCQAVSQSIKHKHTLTECARLHQASIHKTIDGNAVPTQITC